jgi:alpha-D-xyloside xylohydrolase
VWAAGVTLRVLELPEGHDSITTVPSETGEPTTFRTRREGGRVTVSSDDARAPWAVQLGEHVVRAEGAGSVELSV